MSRRRSVASSASEIFSTTTTSPGSSLRNDGGRNSSKPSRSTQAEARIGAVLDAGTGIGVGVDQREWRAPVADDGEMLRVAGEAHEQDVAGHDGLAYRFAA